MLRRDWFPALAFGAAVTLALSLYVYMRRDPPQPVGPHTLREVARVAEQLGLYHRSDILSGEVSMRLVVSDQPLTFERANSLHVGDADHPCWCGTVAAFADGKAFLYLSDPESGILWGDVFLYGDPTMIRRIISAATPNDFTSVGA